MTTDIRIPYEIRETQKSDVVQHTLVDVTVFFGRTAINFDRWPFFHVKLEETWQGHNATENDEHHQGDQRIFLAAQRDNFERIGDGYKSLAS